MKTRNKIGAASTAVLVGVGLAIMPVMTAEAHTPNITANCSGVSLKATSYDSNKVNTWTATVGGVTQSGTFGASLSLLLPVAQENSTTSYTATIQAEDGSYSQTKTGSVGPCGTTTIQLPILGATDPTCSSPGYLSPNFTKWPAAQNPNGYEGDGFRVYISPAYSGPGTYTATLQKVGAGFDPKYPNGTKVVGQTTQTIVVQPQISDEICAGDQPENKVDKTEWVDEKLTCDARAVTQTRWVTTTPYKRVGQTWVLDTDKAQTVSETQYRTKTSDEIKPCIEIPKSIFTDDESEVVDCETRTYTHTKNFYQSDPVWNGETRSYDSFTEPYLIDTDVTTRDASVEELVNEECFTLITVSPIFPTQVDACGTANDSRGEAVSTEQYDIITTINPDGSADYVAVAKDGFEFAEGVVTTAHLDPLTNKDCGSLALTGVETVAAGSIAGGLLALGLALMLIRRRKVKAEA